MNDSDPRPMPPQVLAAYRDPLNLTDLLASEVFTDGERWSVRDELLERLVRKHGNVEVEIGKGTRTLPIRKRVAQFRKSVWGSIEVMVSAEELGGGEAVMLELATVMQPYWLRWWEAMDWSGYGSMRDSIRIADHVLGRRQLAWLAAQYARSVVGISSERQFSIDAISAAEAWAIVPSEENHERAERAYNAAYGAARRTDTAAYADADESAYDAAYAAAYADAAAVYAVYAADSAVYAVCVAAAPAVYAAARTAARARLCELTKQLITPTLVTHASGALR
jgi:hypothetical protein